MSYIDERIVEMRFDNKQFESGAKETLSTLSRLKEALNLPDHTKSLEQLQKTSAATDLSTIAAGVETLQKRFSTLGIIGMQVIQNITNALTGNLMKGINFVTDSIISGGIRRAMNIENAHFQLQALLKDEVLVQEIMNNAMDSVTGTAYAYDEAAKAASQFAASGVQAGDQMLQSLRGIVGVAAMTNSEYEGISRIFTTVAGNGRLMGDQLLQLSSRGLNAASTIADFVNRVNSGTAEASDGIKELVYGLTDGLQVTEGDIRDFVSKGKISFDLFSAAMTEAFADSAERANETFTGAFSNMKAALARIGAEFVSPLVAQSSDVVLLFNALMKQIDNVKKAMTFSESLGNVNALSKQFTDAVLTMARAATNFVTNTDLTKPLSIFYYWIEIVKAGAIDLFAIIKPIATALSETFFSFGADDVINLSDKILEFVRSLKLSDTASQNLHDTFKGLFDVIKLVVDIFVKLLSAIIPIKSPIESLGGGILALTGWFGRLLSSVSEFVRTSPSANKAFDLLATVLGVIFKLIVAVVDGIRSFVETGILLEPVKTTISGISTAFEKLGKVSAPYLEVINGKLKAFKNYLLAAFPKTSEQMITSFITLITKLGEAISKMSFKNPFTILTDMFKTVESVSGGKASIIDILNPFKALSSIASTISDSLNNSEIGGKLHAVMDSLDEFAAWVKNVLYTTFGDASFAGIFAGGVGVAFVISTMTLINSLTKVANAADSLKGSLISNILEPIKGTILAYQRDIKAETLIKIAEAVAIFAGSILALSFGDPMKIFQVSLVLGIFSGAFLLAVTKFLEAGNFLNNLTKAFTMREMSGAIKSFALAIGIISASIYAFTLMYKDNEANMQKALGTMGEIIGVLSAMIIVMSILGDKVEEGIKVFSTSSKALLAVSASVLIIVAALKSLMDIEFTADYKTKLKTLGEIVTGMTLVLLIINGSKGPVEGAKVSITPLIGLSASLILVVQAINSLMKQEYPENYVGRFGILAAILTLLLGLTFLLSDIGGSAGSVIPSTTPILMLAGSLVLIVVAMNNVMKMEIPSDFVKRMGILALLIGSLTAVTIAINKASPSASSAVQSATPILAIGASLFLIVKSLNSLFKLDLSRDWLGKLAILASCFIGLGGVLVALNKISKTSGGTVKAASTILAASAFLAVLTGSLAVLTIFPGLKLLKGATMLGLVLVALGFALAGAGRVVDKSAASAVLAMAVMTGTIVASLGVLSLVSLGPLAKAVVALGAVLLAISKALKSASGTSGYDSAALVLAMVLETITIGTTLVILAGYDWPNVLAAAVALSGVLLAVSKSLKIIEGITVTIDMVEALGLALVSLLGVAGVLIMLSDKPWDGMLAGATAMAEVMLSMGALMGICTLIGRDAKSAIEGLVVFDAFLINFALILTALGALHKIEGYDQIMSDGAQGLGQLGNAIGSFVGNLVAGFVGGAVASLPAIGQALSDFMTNAQSFIDGASKINFNLVTGVGALVATVLLITATDVILGITRFLGLGNSMGNFAAELEKFGPAISDFADTVKNVDASSVQGAAAAASIMAELASKLPDSGGLKAKILGDNKLSDFGAELVSFGPDIVEFASKVSGVESSSVQGAAAAASLMSELANGLPEPATLKGKIFGDTTLSDFGIELLTFGPSLVAFSNIVKNVTPASVQGAAAAAGMMSELANGLPQTGGLKEFFTGSNNIATFGTQLVSFGKSLSAFASSVSGINTGQFGEVMDEFKKLITISESTIGLDTSGMSNFATALKKMANNAIQAFISEFENSTKKVGNAVDKMMNSVISSIDKKNSEMSKQGQKSVTELSSSMKSTMSTESSKLSTEMESFGKNTIQGFIKGITDKASLSSIKVAASSMASTVSSTVRSVLDIHSPSKVLQEIGNNVGEGLKKGIEEKVPIVKTVASTLGSTVTKAVTEGINADTVKSAATNLGSTITSSVTEGLNLDTIYKVYGEALTPVTNVVDTVKDISAQVSQTQQKDALVMKESTTQLKTATTQKKVVQEEVIAAEKSYWEKLLEVKKQGAEAEKYQDMEIADYEKEVLENTISVLQNYADSLESARDSIMSSMDLFSEVTRDEDEEPITKSQLIQNLEDQIEVYEEYANTLDDISARIGDSPLGEYLMQLGIDSLDELNAINSMTDEELTRYSNLYDDKLALATQAAVTQLSGLQLETENKLADIFGVMQNSVSLFDFSAAFDGSLASVTAYAENLSTAIQHAKESVILNSQEVTAAMQEGIEQGLSPEELGARMSAAIEASLAAFEASGGEAANLTGAEIGKFLNQGVGEGMEDDMQTVADAAENLIKTVNDALKAAGEINSPSELTKREVGVFLAEGVAEGMTEDTSSFTEAATQIMTTIVEAFGGETENVNQVGQAIVETIQTSIQAGSPELTSSASVIGESIISGIQAKNADIQTAIKTILTNMISTITQSYSSFLQGGTGVATQYLTGIKNKYAEATSTGTTFGNQVLTALNALLPKFTTTGTSSASNFINAIKSKTSEAGTVAKAFGTEAVNALVALEANFKTSGVNAAQGFINGLKSKTSEAAAAGRALGRAAKEAMDEYLDIGSPSKLFAKIGGFTGEGFVNGMLLTTAKVAKAAYHLGETAVDSASESAKDIGTAFNEANIDLDGEPTIKPIVDLSNVENSVREIQNLFNEAIMVNTRSALGAYGSVTQMKAAQTYDTKSADKSEEKGNTYQFIQNNNSPKALSRIEIYRQTKNQFNQFKEAVDNA